MDGMRRMGRDGRDSRAAGWQCIFVSRRTVPRSDPLMQHRKGAVHTYRRNQTFVSSSERASRISWRHQKEKARTDVVLCKPVCVGAVNLSLLGPLQIDAVALPNRPPRCITYILHASQRGGPDGESLREP